jgi:hypothetical protein
MEEAAKAETTVAESTDTKKNLFGQLLSDAKNLDPAAIVVVVAAGFGAAVILKWLARAIALL